MKLKQLVCMVPETVHKELKLISVEENKYLQDIINEIFKNYLINRNRYHEENDMSNLQSGN